MMEFEMACCLGLTDSQAFHYPSPLTRHPLVSRLWFIRSRKTPYGTPPRTTFVGTSRFTPLRLLQMYGHCSRLARRDEVRGFVSFNPFPYGLIAMRAAHRRGKAVHFGFIGPDWYWHMRSRRGRFLLPYVKRADFVTATGEGMRREMIAAGVPADRIAVLPHCIDVEHYPVADPAAAEYACVYVGKLIHRKRVDVILRAFAAVASSRPPARFCIVGDGPLRNELRRLAGALGIAGAVDFAGYRDDVVSYLSRARINVMASSEEGFPFSLVEGICCGLVPVTTPVGTIPDLLTDGRNGFLFAEGDAAAAAQRIGMLLDDDALFNRMRREVLRMRNGFSYDRATAVWDGWLRSLAP